MDYIRMIVGPDEGPDLAQLCMRTVFLFVYGIFCIRVAGRRTFAQYSPLDIIVALIIGSNISRLMMAKAPLVSGMAITLLLALLHRMFALAMMRCDWLGRVVKGPAIRVIVDGRIDPAALRRANLSEADLLEAIRMEQVEDPADVRLAMVEAGGKVSVVPAPKVEGHRQRDAG
jgi:uncharacterized membrane protein YcaP (DUF421 family)